MTGRFEHSDARPAGSYRLVLAHADASAAREVRRGLGVLAHQAPPSSPWRGDTPRLSVDEILAHLEGVIWERQVGSGFEARGGSFA